MEATVPNTAIVDQGEMDPRKLWDLLAPRFIQNFVQAPVGCDELLHLLSLAGPNPAVLDVGCGPGHVVSELDKAQEHHPISGYVGVDWCSQMIDEARKQNPNHDFRIGEIGRLGLVAPETFDLFLALCVFAHFGPETLAPALRDIRSRMRTGGVGYLLLDYGHGEAFWTSENVSVIPEGMRSTQYQWNPLSLKPHLEATGFLLKEASYPCQCHFGVLVEAV